MHQYRDELPEVRHDIADIISNGPIDGQAVYESIDAIMRVESMPTVTVVRNGQSRDVPGTLAAQLMTLAQRTLSTTFTLSGSTVTFA